MVFQYGDENSLVLDVFKKFQDATALIPVARFNYKFVSANKLY